MEDGMLGEVYSEGDRIIFFEESCLYTGLQLRKEHGRGPFRVVKTKMVPEPRCGCGADEVDAPHFDFCEKHERNNLQKGVGHPQWVTIRTRSGELLLSGALVRKAPIGLLERIVRRVWALYAQYRFA